MNAHLVVGWDGSASARHALEWALKQKPESLLLVEVVDAPGGFGTVGGSPDLADDAVSLETAAADAERAHPGSRIETRLLVGDPIEQLAALAAPGTLLVVGDRRRDLLPLRAGWSKGARLAARATGPVAIITHDAPIDDSGVLVGVDDSDDARAALEFAADWAAQTRQELHVLHAWRTPFVWNDRGVSPTELLEEVTAQHAAVLASAVAEAEKRHPGLVVTGTEIDGVASRALVEAAAGRGLLVVGDGGVSRLERMLIGSVGHDVLVNLEIPTVVVGRHALTARLTGHQAVAAAPRPIVHRAPTRTVVAWDGSVASRSAVQWAVRRERTGSLEIVMIADEAATVPDSAAAESTRELDERTLDHLMDEIHADAPDIALRGRVVRGFVLHTLAGLTDPDTLLVVGTEDREGPRLRFGLSVGAHLSPLARGPVAIVPHTVDPALTGVAVGVDGSERSNAAIAVGVAEAAHRGESLHLVHAWDEPTVYAGEFLLDAAFVTALEEEHAAILAAAAALARTLDPAVTVETHLFGGNPARALARLDPRPAMIVVGTRGLTGWRRLLLGSVSRELILNIGVPLIVVGEPGEASSEQSETAREEVSA